MNFPFNEVLALKDMIQYRNHQISSRILLSTDTLDLILYAMAEEESISSESSPRDKFFYMLDGILKVSTDSDFFIIEKDQSLLIEKNKKHVIEAIGNCKYIQINS